MLTDLATDVNTANTNSPVVSSASYNFVAGDVGSWVFVSSGTHWQPGYYKIASVAANKATLSAAIGAAVLYATGGPYGLNTAAGCTSDATVTLTAGTGSVDYSQAGTAVVSNTNLASSNGTNATPTVTSVSRTFTKNDVGNHLSITAGTNWTTGIFRITSVSAGGAILDRACGSSASLTSGTFAEGGCLASPGQAGLNGTGQSATIFIKNATYTITSATLNVAGGCITVPGTSSSAASSYLIGYNSLRTDAPKGSSRPLLQASGISTFTMVSCSNTVGCYYIIVDAAALTAGTGFSGSATGRAYYCTAKNCKGVGFQTISTYICDGTGCSAANGAFNTCFAYGCVAWSNTTMAFSNSPLAVACLAVNNSGVSSDGFQQNGISSRYVNCTAYGNGRDGFRITAPATLEATFINCISYGNTGTNFNTSAASDNCTFVNCAAGSGAANFSTSITSRSQIGNITLTADPFTAKSSGDFSLNSTAGGGALCKAKGIIGAFPGASTINTTTYQDVGAVQSAGSAASGGFVIGS